MSIVCLWCGSADVEEIAEFGPTLMVSPHFCLACHSPFEVIRQREEMEGTVKHLDLGEGVAGDEPTFRTSRQR